MKPEDLLKRIDEVIALGNQTIATLTITKLGPDYVDPGLFREFRSAALSFFSRSFGKDSTYFHEFEHTAKNNAYQCALGGVGILKAARSEIANGWLFTVKGIVSAELFSDFLDMAKHLLDEHYKDPAAVMTGSILEEHLRELCRKNSIPVETSKPDGSVSPLKADAMNAELAKASVYTKLDQKSVTAWLDLRNKAAHGHYTEYTEAQVELMLAGVMNFLARCPI